MLGKRRMPPIIGNTSFCGLVYPLSFVFSFQIFIGASTLLQSQVHLKLNIYLTVSGAVGSIALGFLLLMCFTRQHDSDHLVWTVVAASYLFLCSWLCLGIYWLLSEEKQTDIVYNTARWSITCLCVHFSLTPCLMCCPWFWSSENYRHSNLEYTEFHNV